jgi:hypothetical protein
LHCFGAQTADKLERSVSERFQEIQPKLGLVGFFDDHRKARDELAPRAAVSRGPVIRRDSRAGSEQLGANQPTEVVVAKVSA